MKGLATAKKNQKRLQDKCYCQAKKDHKALLERLGKKLVADQSATWQQAHKLKCVLAGTTMNRCTIPAMPTLTLNSLGSAAEAANCAKTYCEQHCTASNVNGCNGCILGAPSFCHRYDVTDNTYQKDNSAWWGHPCHTLCVSDGPTSAARKACDKRFRDFRNNPRGWYI